MKLITMLSLGLALAAGAIAAPTAVIEPGEVQAGPPPTAMPRADTGDDGVQTFVTVIEGYAPVLTAMMSVADNPILFHVAGMTKITRSMTAIPTLTPGKPTMLILPFHYQLTEYCEDGVKMVKSTYSNGNYVLPVSLGPDEYSVNHLIPGFPNFMAGAFDYNTDHVRFNYDNGEFQCEWYDYETWKQCGECRAAQWSGAALDCGSEGSRTKEMDCSFILGWASSLIGGSWNTN
ncbi:hypothetical protein EJ02DRAFT_510704 [Clathrospora elynae]|uniref:Uncharacterized protein n=1 Tax=Clathrospora elynae TaxID=706981 RepID=A0A6A5SU82_9PLEO|nr:hypothetical protein EJ02DRAFT_510704 [Clathrospora elynae]